MQGSPPRVRGTETRLRHHPTNKRITPACAGNSAAAAGRREHEKDHPRVCGEQNTAAYRPVV